MSERTKFAVGDIVRLKSGGPNMTVLRPDGGPDQMLVCVWFDVNRKHHIGGFPEAALVHGDPGDSDDSKNNLAASLSALKQWKEQSDKEGPRN